VAAKTGTTTDFRDNWTVGYTPNLVVGVWVGNADNTPMQNVTGVSGAGPIWNQFMRSVLLGRPEIPFDVPEGIERAQVCARSGLLPTALCPQYRWEWFIEGTIPTAEDNLYQEFVIDRTTGLLATDETPQEDQFEQVFLVLPPEARSWAAREGIPAPPIGAHLVGFEDDPVRLLSPDPYTVFQLTNNIPLEDQRIRLRAAIPSDAESVSYWLDGELVTTSRHRPFEVWWQLLPGEHIMHATATLSDNQTLQSDPVEFLVKSWVPPDERPVRGDAE
jgi:membrane carboxypeptidase/penicillin-binding protein PbpC